MISSCALLTYVSLSKQTSPVTISPCAHNFPHPSSCIIASCLLAAAGASQWPRYNESLWPSDPAACSAQPPPAATSLLSLPSLHDPHLHGYQCKMAPGRRLHAEHFSDCDSLLWRIGWEWVQKLSSADNSLRIRVTSFTHPPVIWLTRPRSLLWFSDYMQSCNYYGELPWICKLGDKASRAWRVSINTVRARHADVKTSPVRKTQVECLCLNVQKIDSQY